MLAIGGDQHDRSVSGSTRSRARPHEQIKLNLIHRDAAVDAINTMAPSELPADVMRAFAVKYPRTLPAGALRRAGRLRRRVPGGRAAQDGDVQARRHIRHGRRVTRSDHGARDRNRPLRRDRLAEPHEAADEQPDRARARRDTRRACASLVVAHSPNHSVHMVLMIKDAIAARRSECPLHPIVASTATAANSSTTPTGGASSIVTVAPRIEATVTSAQAIDRAPHAARRERRRRRPRTRARRGTAARTSASRSDRPAPSSPSPRAGTCTRTAASRPDRDPAMPPAAELELDPRPG